MSDDAPFTLDESQVRRLVRLLADALAPDDGRAAKVGRLMAGLCAWVDADGWFWVRTRMDPAGGPPQNYDFLYGGGLDDRHLATFAERTLEVRGPSPENGAVRARMAAGGDFAVTRGEVVPDALWAAPEHQDYVRRFGHDAHLYCVRQLRGGGDPAAGVPGLISCVVLLRRVGRPQFAPRDARLAQAVIAECGPLHADGLNLAVAPDVAQLTPRQRTVLAMLIDGHGAKMAAHRLGLSVHTVNDHCKAIYRHFGVNSRVELLRRFMAGARV